MESYIQKYAVYCKIKYSYTGVMLKNKQYGTDPCLIRMLLFGFQARFAAFGLAIFSIITAFIFHSADDQAQHINFMKNLAMSGGLFYLMLHGADRLSLDHVIEKVAHTH